VNIAGSLGQQDRQFFGLPSMGTNTASLGKKKNKNAPSSKRKRQVILADREESRGYLYVDVARVRFQHSRIRPVFSGCCRSVVGTLESIRHGKLSPHDLPPIQVSFMHIRWECGCVVSSF
jgi:hypothetical protein